MIHHPMARHLFILRPRFPVVAIRIDRDAAAWSELAPYLDVARVHQLDQIVHDDVDAILVKITVIAEAEQVQLERFALNHFDVRNVADVDRRKVWLASNRAQAGEFRAVEFYEIIAVRMLVVKRLQYARVIGVVVRCSLISQKSEGG